MVLPPEGGNYRVGESGSRGLRMRNRGSDASLASAFRRHWRHSASCRNRLAGLPHARLGRRRRGVLASLIVSLARVGGFAVTVCRWQRFSSWFGRWLSRPASSDGRGPRARGHRGPASPAACGVRPSSCRATPGAWDDADLRRAIVHELEHVRRHDWVVQLAARAVAPATGSIRSCGRRGGALPRSGARVRRRRCEGGRSD